MKKSYSEKLLDPRWQRKRLETMESADFKCEACDAADKTLHVHHLAYRKNAEPWDYARNELAVLCKECHEEIHESSSALDRACVLAKKEFGLSTGYLEEITGMILGYVARNVRPLRIQHLNQANIEGMARIFNMSPDEIKAAIRKDGMLNTDDL